MSFLNQFKLAALLLACAGFNASAVPVDTSAVSAMASSSTLAPGWQQGAFIEIFVRGYQDSDGDGIGDLRGLTQRLDYLKELGVKGIWLMPITASADHDHGYATTDFRAIEPAYGSLADLDELLKQAHARGIGVIIDYVINHSAMEHSLFQQSLQGKSNGYRDWFVWQDSKPKGWDIWGKDPWFTTPSGSYFGTFGAHMPDFNMLNPQVLDYHRSSLRFWLNRGLDGFRLDAVPHLVETDAVNWNDQPESRRLTKEFQDLIKSYPQRHVVCEATASPMIWADPKVCGSAFAFGLQYELIKAARGERKAIAKVADYFKTAPLTMATMLSSHDIFAGLRVWDQLKGDVARYKLAAASYLLQPGTPYIYYGEEIGMAGVAGLGGDEPLRAPMSWTAEASGFTAGRPFRAMAPNALAQNAQAQASDGASILNFYKAMLKLRNSLPSIAQGSYEAATAAGQTLSFQRRFGAELSLVVINYADSAQSIRLAKLPGQARLQPAYPEDANSATADRAGRATLKLPARSVAVYRITAEQAK